MALTLFQAAKLSRNPLSASIFKAIATSDEMLAMLPMVRKSGESFMYNREKDLPSAEFVAPDHSSLTESSAEFDRVTVPLRLLVTDVDTYVFAETQMQDTAQQRATQVRQKLRAVGRKIADKAINGAWASSVALTPAIAGVTANAVSAWQDTDRHGPGSVRYDQAAGELEYRAPGDRTYGAAVDVSTNGTYILPSDNPSKTLTVTIVAASLPGADTEVLVYMASTTDEPDGLKKLISSGQQRAAVGVNGDALDFDVMDELIDLVKSDENLAFVMNAKLRRKFYALNRALGGADPMHMTLPGINGNVPTYRGIPILKNDYILSDETVGSTTDASSLYLVDFAPESGFYAGVGGEGVQSVELTPRDVMIQGIRVRDVGELHTKEAMRTRVSWYGAYALGSDLSAAVATGLQTA
jgi:hypothetical protein